MARITPHHRLTAKVMVAIGAIVGAQLGCLVAWALFSGTSPTQTNRVTAGAVGAGSAPTFTVSGRDVILTWPATANASSYKVARANVAPQNLSTTVNPSCAGVVGSPTCTDKSLPLNGATATNWTYSVTPSVRSWRGTGSPPSATVTIPAPALTLGSDTFSADGSVTTATVENFFDDEIVTFCLDKTTATCPAAKVLGTVTVPHTGGTATVPALTVPAGISTGNHTISAVGSISSVGARGTSPSVAVTVGSGAASRLAFTTGPTSPFTAGQASSLQVSVQDTNGNLVATDNTTTVTLALGANPGGATLTCTNPNGVGPVTAVVGVASFTCSLDKVGTGYTLVATSDPAAHATVTSPPFAVQAGPAAALALSSPATVASGSKLTVTATVTDAGGNPITSGPDSTVPVDLAVISPMGGGTVEAPATRTVNAVAGVASADFTAALAGPVTVQASTSLNFTATRSAEATIMPGAAARIGLVADAAGDLASGSTRTLTATVTDAAGNPVTSGAGSTAPIAFRSVAGVGPGTVTWLNTPPAQAGVATAVVAGNVAGAARLKATATVAGTPITSDGLDVTIVAGPASKIALSGSTANLTSDATRILTATVTDDAGNTVTTGADAAATVTFAQTGGPGTVSGLAAVPAGAGVATDTVTGLLAGGVTIQATGTVGGQPVESNQLGFTVVAGAPAALTLTSPVVSAGTVACNQGTATCTATGLPAGGTLTAAVSFVDAHGNLTVRSAAHATPITFSPPDPHGALTQVPLSVPRGTTTSSGTFVFTRSADGGGSTQVTDGDLSLTVTVG